MPTSCFALCGRSTFIWTGVILWLLYAIVSLCLLVAPLAPCRRMRYHSFCAMSLPQRVRLDLRWVPLGPMTSGVSPPLSRFTATGLSRIRRNLFIHKARIPARRFSSSTSQHFKMFPPFASNEGYSASGLRYQSDGVRVTHPLPHSEFTRIRERMCDLTLTLSHSPFAYSYISSYSLLIIPSAVL